MGPDYLMEVEWRRVLWKKQPFPDNHVGDSFLRVSKKRRELLFSETLYGATAVTQEICSCLGLVVVFFGISERNVNAAGVLALTASLGIIGYILTRAQLASSAKDDVKVACFYVVLIACASPVVKSLTGSVATDSINACTTFLLILRLVVHDYGTTVAIVNPTVSHNVGVFASVCLASRLDSDLDVFTLMTVAVALFALFPSFRRYCRVQLGRCWDLITTVVVVVCTTSGILLFAPHLLLIFFLALFLCNFFIPALFIHLQSHKQNIYGPWDEAQIEDR
ncbi:phosphatidylinositol N-acetylglucosaminyltransferase subunit C-like [Homarus americanus]|uniref:Phosphatidylinositol N-acetylglucosaminyltransferase subunit C-like n=1 Tax=Homarus americanus TaxID=6706 RepID=A0A8J5J9K3_HOMAM|nr:phosphatidylinositol N-acetylglucosaminyltransferase subunit C-like [Homarus americanus]XP_042206722.1 phosphatidylinositol N-acetylglucosaminyltransferase subunit C-like [Homarus americanus]KAG7154892.1 Phosphatidylinositol N-acetylglucosaminyltransferase subunit C-like [Homarus americanus]